MYVFFWGGEGGGRSSHWDTHLLSDRGVTCSTSATWSYRQQDLEEKDDRLNKSVNDNAVCRSALATPGLLTSLGLQFFFFWKIKLLLYLKILPGKRSYKLLNISWMDFPFLVVKYCDVYLPGVSRHTSPPPWRKIRVGKLAK